MLFEILHETEYSYDEEVFLEPHYLRFKPKSSAHSQIQNFEFRLGPETAGISEHLDVEENHIVFCWFEGQSKLMTISARSEIEVREYNPLNFLVNPAEYLDLPFEYNDHEKKLLQASLLTEALPSELNDFNRDLLSDANNKTVDYITGLTRQINNEFTLQSRIEGAPHQPGITFNDKAGSCRDLAWMQIHLLRNTGIAARFVSGYYYIDSENPEFELHAWTEAYIPGGGWIGLDPGHGILTSQHHFPVASSAFYERTMPVSGSFRGNAKSKLHHDLKITRIN